MADYFLVHDRSVFEQSLRPALTAAWTQRSFAPCFAVCRDWITAAREYVGRYHVNPEGILLFQMEQGLHFDRALWRTLAGELLLFAACEVPQIPRFVDSLVALLAPSASENVPRTERPAIDQALHGSRDLAFGTALYRPQHAGYNDADDVARLAAYLTSIQSEQWTTANIPALPGLETEEDRAEEITFAREWLAVLADLYRRSAEAGRVIVLENLG
jgi:hypothetical protein